MGNSGKESVMCEYNGSPIEIGFNSQYVNDILNHLTSEKEIIFKLHSATKAVIIVPSESKENQELSCEARPLQSFWGRHRYI